jgi:predicted PurR-regulated permease PerM
MLGGIAGVLFFLVSDHPPDFVQFYHILFIMGIFGSVQLFDNFVSYPMISSSTVGMHPMFVIIVVLIGGSILGPFGMIISVPIAATLKVIVEELMWGFKNYRYL